MADMQKLQIAVKIQDLDNFKELAEALAAWAVEVSKKTDRTNAECTLLNAAMDFKTGSGQAPNTTQHKRTPPCTPPPNTS